MSDSKFHTIVKMTDGESRTLKTSSGHDARSNAGALFMLKAVKSVFVYSAKIGPVVPLLYKVKDDEGREIVEKTVYVPTRHPSPKLNPA